MPLAFPFTILLNIEGRNIIMLRRRMRFEVMGKVEIATNFMKRLRNGVKAVSQPQRPLLRLRCLGLHFIDLLRLRGFKSLLP